jgi:hypothetical protein
MAAMVRTADQRVRPLAGSARPSPVTRDGLLSRKLIQATMRKDVHVVMWPNDSIELRWVRVNRSAQP